ncbi:uncharacterized protein TNCV_3785541 [Trichonephila clavipes]|nr:uncharacterized protein TNCV_3785541 [Trichonephila clavipes]
MTLPQSLCYTPPSDIPNKGTKCGVSNFLENSERIRRMAKSDFVMILLPSRGKVEKIPCHRIRAHYAQLSEFERDHIIGMKEKVWTNRRIVRHMGRSDAAIRRCWQKWVDRDRFQRHDGSG